MAFGVMTGGKVFIIWAKEVINEDGRESIRRADVYDISLLGQQK